MKQGCSHVMQHSMPAAGWGQPVQRSWGRQTDRQIAGSTSPRRDREGRWAETMKNTEDDLGLMASASGVNFGSELRGKDGARSQNQELLGKNG